MITIFNRKELIITYSFEKLADIRNKLEEFNIEYSYNSSMFTASLSRVDAEYKIYVMRKDYELAIAIVNGHIKR